MPDKIINKEVKKMPDHSGKVIFIADVSKGMQTYKENLVKELEHFGCTVKYNTFQNHGSDNNFDIIGQCDIAIHILSDKDQMLDSSGKGMEESQIHLSVQHFLSQKLLSASSENGFRIYAWHPKSSLESIYEEEKVSTHLKKIQQLDEVDLLRTNYEEFKYYLLKKIENPVVEVADESFIKGNDNYSIYFIHDIADSEAAKHYVEYLGKRGFAVLTPVFDSDIMAVRQMHNTYLKKFDIAIIFAIDAGINWINMKIMDILKSPGLGREKPILGKAVFLQENKDIMLQLKGKGFDFCPIDTSFNNVPIDDFLSKIHY